MTVSHLQCFGITDRQFMLTKSPFAFGVFYRNARMFEMMSHSRSKRLYPCALENLIIFQVPSCGFQVAIILSGCFVISVTEKIKFQFGSGETFKAHPVRLIDLFSEDRAWCD